MSNWTKAKSEYPLDTMTLEELAKRLGISRATSYQLARTDSLPIPVIRVGDRFLFSRAAYEQPMAPRHESTAEEVAA